MVHVHDSRAVPFNKQKVYEIKRMKKNPPPLDGVHAVSRAFLGSPLHVRLLLASAGASRWSSVENGFPKHTHTHKTDYSGLHYKITAIHLEIFIFLAFRPMLFS